MTIDRQRAGDACRSARCSRRWPRGCSSATGCRRAPGSRSPWPVPASPGCTAAQFGGAARCRAPWSRCACRFAGAVNWTAGPARRDARAGPRCRPGAGGDDRRRCCRRWSRCRWPGRCAPTAHDLALLALAGRVPARHSLRAVDGGGARAEGARSGPAGAAGGDLRHRLRLGRRGRGAGAFGAERRRAGDRRPAGQRVAGLARPLPEDRATLRPTPDNRWLQSCVQHKLIQEGDPR